MIFSAVFLVVLFCFAFHLFLLLIIICLSFYCLSGICFTVTTLKTVAYFVVLLFFAIITGWLASWLLYLIFVDGTAV